VGAEPGKRTGIRSVPLEMCETSAGRPQPANELMKALAGAFTGPPIRQKARDDHFQGEGERPIRIGYVWNARCGRPVYRLILTNARFRQASRPRLAPRRRTGRCKVGDCRKSN